MSERIGILVDPRALRRTLRGEKTHEQISLYKEIASAEGTHIIVFSINTISVNRNKLWGYIPSPQGWQKVWAPIPRVIHKRVLFHSHPPLKVLDRLHRRGIVFINPPRMQNKLKMNAILSGEPSVKTHLPPTWEYQWVHLKKRLDSGQNIILKPKIGSVGLGILKIVPVSELRVRMIGTATRVLSHTSLRKRLRARIHSSHYLMQEYLNLAQYNGRPFDLRVPVQRNGYGEWTVPGMVAKVAGPHPFLTNLAQGGCAIPGETALNAAFAPSIAATIAAEIRQLSLNVAQAVAREYPYAADLGLDIGVDADGKPWLIEVNTRDQRITFAEAGLHAAFRTLYENPISYCAYVLSSFP